MSAYHFTLITPEGGKLYDAPIESLVAPGMEGAFGVLAQHAPMISGLRNGVLKLKPAGTNEKLFFTIAGGILEVDGHNNVRLLADKAAACRN